MSEDLIDTFQQLASEKAKEISDVFAVASDNGGIDMLKLNIALGKYAGIFAWMAAEYAMCTKALATAHNEFDIWYAEVYEVAMMSAKQNKMPTTNEAMKNSIINSYKEDYASKKQAVIEKDAKLQLAKTLRSVVEREGSVLQTLSANLREELKLTQIGEGPDLLGQKARVI